jgi:hypothetical protein
MKQRTAWQFRALGRDSHGRETIHRGMRPVSVIGPIILVVLLLRRYCCAGADRLYVPRQRGRYSMLASDDGDGAEAAAETVHAPANPGAATRTGRLIALAQVILMTVAYPAQLVCALDHFNLERDIPTTLADIEPIERGSLELQAFGRYSRLRGRQNLGETEPRLAWGAFDQVQLTIATPLRFGEDNANNGNGDVGLEGPWKFMDDRRDAWWPGGALAVELRLPTGVERRGFENGVDVGFTGILKKDVGPHSFHLNIDFERIGDTSAEESLRTYVWDVVAGHDMPLTPWLLLIEDVVWRQADVRGTTDIWLLGVGLRAQLTRIVIGGLGLGVGLNGGPETPKLTITVGSQIGF